MSNKKSLPMAFAEWWEERANELPTPNTVQPSRWLPTPGTVLFTLLIVVGMLFAQNSGLLPLFAAPNAQTTSTGTIAYQGRLADAEGNALTDTVNMGFRLYSATSDDAPLWEELWTGTTSVQVSDGLFNVMLGSVNPIPQDVITGNGNLFLGITVGTDGEMSPRVQLGSVPFATQALTVPDGSITSKKLAPDAIQHYSVEAPQSNWDVPSCPFGATNPANWTSVPGLTMDFTIDETKTVWLDFGGLGFNGGAGHGIFSSIFIDGVQSKRPSGSPDFAGCRNSSGDTGGSPLCPLVNMSSTTLEPGPHTVDVRVYCDGTISGAEVYGGTLRALVLP